MDDGEEPNSAVTVFDRLTRSGLSAERIEWWLAQGGVRVDDQVVTDPATPAEPPARVVLYS